MKSAYIVEVKRTPIGRSHAEKGALRDVRADDLLAGLLRYFAANVMDPSTIDDVSVGCVGQHLEQGKNIARLAPLIAGYPDTVPGVTINRLCGSSLQALNYAALQVGAGQARAVLAGGVEHMHHVPMTAALDYHHSLSGRYEFPFTNMGLTAEKLATAYHISRSEQDSWALQSHQRAARSIEGGLFAREVIPVETTRGLLDRDQGPRHDTSLSALAGLKPAFREDGSVTAGNSCQLGDGASLALIADGDYCQAYGLVPQAVIVDQVVVGLNPTEMGLGPVPSIRRLLERNHLSSADIACFEINEAFAAQVIACIRALALDPGKVNARGGAIALGHPLGATGVRLVATLLNTLSDCGGEYGIAAMCIGHGQGMATLVRRC